MDNVGSEILGRLGSWFRFFLVLVFGSWTTMVEVQALVFGSTILDRCGSGVGPGIGEVLDGA